MSKALWRTRKRVLKMYEMPTHEKSTVWLDGWFGAINAVIDIINDEFDNEAEQQFTRPISKQAEMSQLLKEDK